MNFGSHYVLKKPVFLIEVFDEKKSYIALVPPNAKDAWHMSPTSIDAYLANPKDLSWNVAVTSGGDKKGILDYINRWHPGFPKEVFEKLKNSSLYDYFDLLKGYPDPFFNFNAYYCCRAVGIADVGATVVAHEAYAVDYFSPIASPVNYRRYMRFAKYKNEKDLIVNIDSVLGKKFFEYFEEVNQK
ncbi:hypothetical protein [Vandammella animalimorsus]|uniref:hypothetical protein n=1 Tax=Vandammella animalimorsus TaxID=2029117 RepID=UPI00117807D8|nr:hypothetical protein [Vandammella animalimorsus]